MKQIHFDIQVIGKVQGVGFRAGAAHKAKVLDVSGYVKNNEDGSVTIEVEGKEAAVNEFIRWCHEGPMLASVNDVITTSGEVMNYSDFSIRKNRDNLLE